MLAQQLPHTAKDRLALFQERGDHPPEELRDGLSRDVQGQRVARVHLYQPRSVVCAALQFPFL